MLTEGQVKFQSEHNISGASRQNMVEAFSSATESDGDLFQNVKKTIDKKHKMDPCSSSGVIQISRSPEIPIFIENTLITPFLKAETFTVAAKLMTAAVHVWSQRGWGDSLAS